MTEQKGNHKNFWQRLYEKVNWKIIASAVSACLITIILFVLCFIMGKTPEETALNISIIILGFAVGWLIGMAASPYTMNEKTMFSTYAKAVGVFASGYLVGKIDKVVDRLFDPAFILVPLISFRLIAFIASLIIAVIIVFDFRYYAKTY